MEFLIDLLNLRSEDRAALVSQNMRNDGYGAVSLDVRPIQQWRIKVFKSILLVFMLMLSIVLCAADLVSWIHILVYLTFNSLMLLMTRFRRSSDLVRNIAIDTTRYYLTAYLTYGTTHGVLSFLIVYIVLSRRFLKFCFGRLLAKVRDMLPRSLHTKLSRDLLVLIRRMAENLLSGYDIDFGYLRLLINKLNQKVNPSRLRVVRRAVVGTPIRAPLIMPPLDGSRAHLKQPMARWSLENVAATLWDYVYEKNEYKLKWAKAYVNKSTQDRNRIANLITASESFDLCSASGGRSLGQFKLYTHLETLLYYASATIDRVVYVGSSPGYNVMALAAQHPNIQFDCYDPRVMSGTASNVKHYQKKVDAEDVTRMKLHQSTTLFVSDIRSRANSRVAIKADMELQLNILRHVKFQAFSIKWRVDSGEPHITLPTGDAMAQLWAPGDSTEVRWVNMEWDHKWSTTNTLRTLRLVNAINLARTPSTSYWLYPLFGGNIGNMEGSLRRAGFARQSDIVLTAGRFFEECKIMNFDIAGRTDTILLDDELDWIREQMNITPTRKPRLRDVCGHRLARFCRGHGRHKVIEQLRKSARGGPMVMMGANPIRVAEIDPEIHCCCPVKSEKDNQRNQEAFLLGYTNFCECDLESYLYAPCEKCSKYSRDEDTAVGMVDVQYYCHPIDFQELIDRSVRVISYAHSFDPSMDLDNIFETSTGTEGRWHRKRNDKHTIVWRVKGDGNTYEHSDLSWRKDLKCVSEIHFNWGDGGYMEVISSADYKGAAKFEFEDDASKTSKERSETDRLIVDAMNTRQHSLTTHSTLNGLLPTSLGKRLKPRKLWKTAVDIVGKSLDIMEESSITVATNAQRGAVLDARKRGTMVPGWASTCFGLLRYPYEGFYLIQDLMTWVRQRILWVKKLYWLILLLVLIMYTTVGMTATPEMAKEVGKDVVAAKKFLRELKLEELGFEVMWTLAKALFVTLGELLQLLVMSLEVWFGKMALGEQYVSIFMNNASVK
jgi:hypothetical protein